MQKIIIATVAVTGIAAVTQASTLYWDGSVNPGTYGTANNWSTSSIATTPNPSAAPGSGDNAVFSIDGVTADQTINLTGSPAALSLQFKSSGATTIQASAGIGLALGTGGISIASTAGAVTIGGSGAGSVTVKLTGNQTWQNDSANTLTILNTMQTASATPSQLTLSGSGGYTFSAAIGGTGTATASLVIDTGSNGTVYFNAAAGSTYDGGTTIKTGTVKLGNNAATLGGAGGALSMSGGTLDINSTVDTRAVNLGNFSGTGGTILNNGTNLATISVGLNSGGGVFSGTIADHSGLTATGTVALKKSANGTITLTSNNTYSAGTTINGGQLIVNNTAGSGTGQGAVSVIALNTVSSGVLGGTGTIGGVAGYANANVNVAGVATSYVASISPGDVDGSNNSTIGTLHVGSDDQKNSVTFANYSKLVEQLGNSGNGDKLVINGDLFLNSASAKDALELSTFTGATLGGVYTLATFTGTLTGRFDTITLNGAAIPGPYAVEYRNSSGQAVAGTGAITNGGSIVIAIPEPTSLALFGAAGLFMLRRRTAGKTADSDSIC